MHQLEVYTVITDCKSKAELQLTLESVLKILTDNELSFTMMHKKEVKQIKIISVTDCDSVKVFCPFFEIKLDERMRRYAELMIKYD